MRSQEKQPCPSVPRRRISVLRISAPVPAQPFTNHDSQLKFEIMLPFSPGSSCVWLFVDISCPGNPILTDINPEWSCFSAASPGCMRQLWWFVNSVTCVYFMCRDQRLEQSRVSHTESSTRPCLFCFGFLALFFGKFFLISHCLFFSHFFTWR